MLETAKERVKLLKTGLSQKEIEMLYIEHNNIKIIRTPILYDANDFETPNNPSYPSYSQNQVHTLAGYPKGRCPAFRSSPVNFEGALRLNIEPIGTIILAIFVNLA